MTARQFASHFSFVVAIMMWFSALFLAGKDHQGLYMTAAAFHMAAAAYFKD